MRSLPLADATRRLAPPQSWDHATQGICHTLEISDRVDANGVHWMISAWTFSEAELKRLAAGEPLFLHISARDAVHPVVGFSVGGEA